MTEQAVVEPKKDQKPRHRSPNYPGVGLRAAVAKIEALYKADGLAPSPKLAALKHMGYERFHSEAARTLSALKSFGLVEESAERIKLTQRGIEIVARPQGDERRSKAIHDAALSPDIYQKILEEYRTCGLPSDASLKSDLITVRRFNPTAVDAFVQDFRDSLDFAGLSNIKVLESQQQEDLDSETSTELHIGDTVQWESNGVLRFAEPRKITEISPDGEWAFVEGYATGLPIGELTQMEAIVVPTPQTPTPPPARPPAANASVFKAPPPSQMRSYSWALSGDFNAKMDLFGEAKTEEDIDALADYVEITIKALKRSLKARTGEAS